MTAREAREIGQAWIEEEGCRLPGFRGAHFAGSIAEMPPDAEFPGFTDLDVYWLTDTAKPPPQEKRRWRGVLLEIVPQSIDVYRSAEALLADPFKAGMLLGDVVAADPEGRLGRLQAAVREGHARPEWLRARCEALRGTVERIGAELDAAEGPRDGIWGLLRYTAHLAAWVAIARLRPPTVRRGLARAKSILRETGDLALHAGLLEIVGCAGWDRERVEAALAECAEAYDRAVAVMRTPIGGAFNLSADARPYLVEGAREMIDAGDAPEAMYWIARIRCTAESVLKVDLPPEERAEWAGRFDGFLGGLGLTDSDAYRAKSRWSHKIGESVGRWAGAQPALRDS